MQFYAREDDHARFAKNRRYVRVGQVTNDEN
jgi:hypothetical protein